MGAPNTHECCFGGIPVEGAGRGSRNPRAYPRAYPRTGFGETTGRASDGARSPRHAGIGPRTVVDSMKSPKKCTSGMENHVDVVGQLPPGVPPTGGGASPLYTPVFVPGLSNGNAGSAGGSSSADSAQNFARRVSTRVQARHVAQDTTCSTPPESPSCPQAPASPSVRSGSRLCVQSGCVSAISLPTVPPPARGGLASPATRPSTPCAPSISRLSLPTPSTALQVAAPRGATAATPAARNDTARPRKPRATKVCVRRVRACVRACAAGTNVMVLAGASMHACAWAHTPHAHNVRGYART